MLACEYCQPLNLAILSQISKEATCNSTGRRFPLAAGDHHVCGSINTLVQPRTYNTTAVGRQISRISGMQGTAFLLREGRSGFAYQPANPPEPSCCKITTESGTTFSNLSVGQHSFQRQDGDQDRLYPFTRDFQPVLDPRWDWLIFPHRGGPSSGMLPIAW